MADRPSAGDAERVSALPPDLDPAVLTPADIEEIAPTLDYEVQLESLNQWQLAWRRFRKHRLAMIGSGIFLAMVLVGAIGPLLVPYSATTIPHPDKIVYAGRPPSF